MDRKSNKDTREIRSHDFALSGFSMGKHDIAGGTGITAGGDVNFGDVSGQVAVGEFINQFKIEKPSGEALVKLMDHLDKQRQDSFKIKTDTKPTVFISYSHKDVNWKDKLVTHMGVLQKEGFLDLWDDSQINAGEDWHQKIKQAIEMASVAILLVSADFLTSNFILSEEVPNLLERRDKEGLWIFPVILKPCVWDEVKWLVRMQVRPKDGKSLIGGTEYQIESNLAAIAKEVVTIIHRNTRKDMGNVYAPSSEQKSGKMTEKKLRQIDQWCKARILDELIAREGQRKLLDIFIRGEESND